VFFVAYFIDKGAGKVQSIIRCAKGWTVEELEFDFQQGQKIFLFFAASRHASGPTQLPSYAIDTGEFSLE
jgi:hypothetical protein